ncbi:flavodoxin family protein [Alkalibacter mobilis]|uniref:flavodoxin family protein n=1 Tax=Alkalibacter mobilis TaxID=2787712 RepID=UPI00189F1EA8|nr:flavodoxin family protein [Alkalibacter mobilis]MBF7095609.1 NAD(P)H-dependent oxidoreductase [Alkalibacter mobilis]
MKILGISGGMKDGSNDSMCKEALMAAKEMGADVEFVRLLDLDLKYCTGCVTCSISLVTGKGNRCVLKDDFEWLLDKMLDADGIIISSPIFVKGAPGIFQTLRDRFGPRMDRGMNIIATKIAENGGGKMPDPRILKDKVISYIGIGGSDWATRIACDHTMHALSPMWKIIDNEVFKWSKTIVLDEEKVSRVNQIGKNLFEAAKDIESAQYKGNKGICPHCHNQNFYLEEGSTDAICCTCGIEGKLEIVDGKVAFVFPEVQLQLAHDTLSGKFKHVDDIKENEGKNMQLKKSDEYKTMIEKYKSFISPSKPN